MINTINSAEFDMGKSDIRLRVSRLWSLMWRTGVIKRKEKELTQLRFGFYFIVQNKEQAGGGEKNNIKMVLHVNA
jgi:hypothetical protein